MGQKQNDTEVRQAVSATVEVEEETGTQIGCFQEVRDTAGRMSAAKDKGGKAIAKCQYITQYTSGRYSSKRKKKCCATRADIPT